MKKIPDLEIGQRILPELADLLLCMWFMAEVAEQGRSSLEAAIRTWGIEQPERTDMCANRLDGSGMFWTTNSQQTVHEGDPDTHLDKN